MKQAEQRPVWVQVLRGVLFAGIPLGALLLVMLPMRSKSTAVILYCAQDQVFAEPILAEFTKQTGIRVKAVFDSEAVKTVGLANRLLAERANPVADVFWGNEEFRTRQLVAAGVFVTNGWAAFGQRSRRLVINTNLMPARSSRGDEAPTGESAIQSPQSALDQSLLTSAATGFGDLTNARFAGRISLAFPLFGTTATHLLALRGHRGESNWLAWCRALAANRPFLEEGNSHVVKRVARGEAWLGLTDSDDITAGQREGLPVAALPLGPELLRLPNTVALVAKGNAPSPAARALSDYLQSPAVLARLVEAGALEPASDPAATFAPDWAGMLRDLAPATAQLQEIFRR